MKKLALAILLLLPAAVFAHGGVSKIAGQSILYLYQDPLSPLVGEEVNLSFKLTDLNNQPLKNLDVEATVIETFYGDSSKDKTLDVNKYKTDDNGIFEFKRSFPNSSYYDIDLKYRDDSGQEQTTGFLIQPRQAESAKSLSLEKTLAIFAIGLVVGATAFRLKRNK